MQSSSLYPAVRTGIELHITATEATILVPFMKHDGRGNEDRNQDDRRGMEFISHKPFGTDGYLVEFLSLLDGVTPVETAVEILADRYGEPFGRNLAEQAAVWAATNVDFVEWLAVPLETPRRARMTGNDGAFYPLHATLEIIETCNFTCAHCYYSSSPFKKGRIELEDATRIMDTLAAHGVRVIELTGGECTIHPQFLDILNYASKTFDLVAVISNGYRLGTDDKLCESVCALPNVIAQISIDAIGERHDEFRRHAGSFAAAVKAVRRLVGAGVVTRISSSISEASLDQVEALYGLGRELGVPMHTFAPIAQIGRGCNITDPGAGAERVVNAINSALAPFAGDPAISALAKIPAEADAYEPERNCGAGWKTVAIDYNGDVRVCNYSRDSKKLGNVLREPYELIFGQKALFLFNNAPRPGGRDCDGCRYQAYCSGCFVKAFMLSEHEYPECAWRRRWFPEMPLSLDSTRDKAGTRLEKLQSRPNFAPEDGAHVCHGCRSNSASHVPASSLVELTLNS